MYIPLPMIMLRSPSPSEAAAMSGASNPIIAMNMSRQWTGLGSGCLPPKSGRGSALTTNSGGSPSSSTRIALA